MEEAAKLAIANTPAPVHVDDGGSLYVRYRLNLPMPEEEKPVVPKKKKEERPRKAKKLPKELEEEAKEKERVEKEASNRAFVDSLFEVDERKKWMGIPSRIEEEEEAKKEGSEEERQEEDDAEDAEEDDVSYEFISDEEEAQ